MASILRQATDPVVAAKLREEALRRSRRNYLRHLATTNLAKPPISHHHGLFYRVTHAPGDFLAKATGQVADSLIHTPQGIYEIGKAGTLDIKDFATKGDVTPERLGHLGQAFGTQVVQDVRHPLRNPGYLLLDLLMAEQLGASTLGRLGAASRAARAARAGELDAAGKPIVDASGVRTPEPPARHPHLEGQDHLKGKATTPEAADLAHAKTNPRLQVPPEAFFTEETPVAPVPKRNVFGRALQQLIHIPGKRAEVHEHVVIENTKHIPLSKENYEGTMGQSGRLRGGIRLGLLHLRAEDIPALRQVDEFGRAVPVKKGHYWVLKYRNEYENEWRDLTFKPSKDEEAVMKAAGMDEEQIKMRHGAPVIIPGGTEQYARRALDSSVRAYESGVELRDLPIVQATKRENAIRLGLVEHGQGAKAPENVLSQKLDELVATGQVAPEVVAQDVQRLTINERLQQLRERDAAAAAAQGAAPTGEAISFRKIGKHGSHEFRRAVWDIIPFMRAGVVNKLGGAHEILGVSRRNAQLITKAAEKQIKAQYEKDPKRLNEPPYKLTKKHAADVAARRQGVVQPGEVTAETTGPGALAARPTTPEPLPVQEARRNVVPEELRGQLPKLPEDVPVEEEIRALDLPPEDLPVAEVLPEEMPHEVEARLAQESALAREATAAPAAGESEEATLRRLLEGPDEGDLAQAAQDVEHEFKPEPVGIGYERWKAEFVETDSNAHNYADLVAEGKTEFGLSDADIERIHDEGTGALKEKTPREQADIQATREPEEPRKPSTVEEWMTGVKEPEAAPAEAAAAAPSPYDTENAIRVRIAELDAAGAPDSAYIGTVSSAARVIKWDKFSSNREAVLDWLDKVHEKIAKREQHTQARERPAAPVEPSAPKSVFEEIATPQEFKPVGREGSRLQRAAADLAFLKRQGGTPEQIAAAQEKFRAAQEDAQKVQASKQGPPTEDKQDLFQEQLTKEVRDESRANTEKKGTRASGTSDRQLHVSKNQLVEKYGVPIDKWEEVRAAIKDSLLRDKTNQLAIFERILGRKMGREVWQKWDEEHRIGGGSGVVPPEDYVDTQAKGVPRTGGEAAILAFKTFFKKPPALTLNIAPPTHVPRSGVPLQQYVEQFEQPTLGLYEMTLSRHPTIQAGQRAGIELRQKLAGEIPGRTAQIGKVFHLDKKSADYLAWKRKQVLAENKAVNEGIDLSAITYNMTKSQREDYMTKATEKATKEAEGGPWKRFLDTIAQMTTMGVLYAKGPAFWFPNWFGQGLVFGAHAKWNVPKAVQAAKLMHDVGELSPMAQEMLMSGIKQSNISSLARAETGLRGPFGKSIRAAHKGLGDVYSGGIQVKGRTVAPGIDRQFRGTAIGLELIDQGFKTPEAVIEMVTNGEQRGRMIDIVKRADDDEISFTHMSKTERDTIRRYVFFYPWIKGASRYSVRFLANNPIQSAVMIQAGREAAKRQEGLLPQLPGYLQGVIRGPDINLPFFGNLSEENVPGIGKVPRIFNPAAVTVLPQFGEVLSTLQANVLSGDVKGYERLATYLNPTYSTGLAAVTHANPFTGADYPTGKSIPSIISDQALNLFALSKVVKDYQQSRNIQAGTGRAASEFLEPRTVSDVIGRGAIGVGPIPINPKKATSLHFAEESSVASKVQREWMKHTRDRQTYHDTLVRLGLLKPNQKLPENLQQAFVQRAQRQANQAAFTMARGHQLNTLERLEADLGLLVRQKRLSSAFAISLLKALSAGATDTQVERIARKVREVMFGPDVISKYKNAINKQLDARGEPRITVP